MSLHRGLALALVMLGSAYVGLGPWLATGHGPAKTAFEGVRRYDTALQHARPGLASLLGEQAVALAQDDPNWSPGDLAALEANVAQSELAARHPARATKLARAATAQAGSTSLPLMIDVARARTMIALASDNGIEVACALGTLLEEIGLDRVAHPEQSIRPHPELQWLSGYISEIGPRLHASARAPAWSGDTLPLTLTSGQ